MLEAVARAPNPALRGPGDLVWPGQDRYSLAPLLFSAARRRRVRFCNPPWSVSADCCTCGRQAFDTPSEEVRRIVNTRLYRRHSFDAARWFVVLALLWTAAGCGMVAHS